MSDDVVDLVRFWAEGPNADLFHKAADEIERLRAESAALIADNRTLLSAANEEATNLTEALRLMEPVVAAEATTQWPVAVCIERYDARAIADFVKCMKGERDGQQH